jgi:hypothetical protein
LDNYSKHHREENKTQRGSTKEYVNRRYEREILHTTTTANYGYSEEQLIGPGYRMPKQETNFASSRSSSVPYQQSQDREGSPEGIQSGQVYNTGKSASNDSDSCQILS